MNYSKKGIYIITFWCILIFVYLFHIISKIFFLKSLLKLSHQNNTSVLFLVAFYPENAGYHYRVKKWADIIDNCVAIKYVYEKEKFHTLLKGSDIIHFQMGFLLKRLYHIFLSYRYKTVIVRRSILLYNYYGGTFLERLLISTHPNVILDFDDDINLHELSKNTRSTFGKLLLENKNKFYDTLRIYKKFIVGSDYLKSIVIRENKTINPNHIAVIPTCVDYNKYDLKSYDLSKDSITFGWIGTEGNLKYLDKTIDALNKVNKEYPIELLVISSKDYTHKNANFEIKNLRWSLKEEINHLYQIDVGLMPLENSPLEKGKCGFKLIQYMGLGIVSIASAVTVNNEIVSDNEDSFLVFEDNDWYEVMKRVVDSKVKFNKIGDKARKKVEERYTFDANKIKYIDFLK